MAKLFAKAYKKELFMDTISRELGYKEYVMREDYSFHAPYNPEVEFYEAVRDGNRETVDKALAVDFCDKKGLGELSLNSLQSFKYHFVITAAMLSRYCIDGGMEHEQAYHLSDLYINKADICTSKKELSALHKKMVKDYMKRMINLKTDKVYSKHIVLCINYIYDHLHEKITIGDAAAETGVSEGHLSRLFKKETGMTFNEYVMRKKTETARNMIDYSGYSLSQIANILAFGSQSYFVKVFKKYEGITPGKYYSTHLPSATI